jgi:hypothetical protein
MSAAVSSAGRDRQSTLASDVFTTGTHIAISSRMNFAKSSGLAQAVSMPAAARRFRLGHRDYAVQLGNLDSLFLRRDL